MVLPPSISHPRGAWAVLEGDLAITSDTRGSWVDLDTVSGLSVGVGWHLADESTVMRLAGSLRKFGQLRPILVGVADGVRMIIDGGLLLAALRLTGKTEVWILDLGDLRDYSATDLGLGLLCCGDVDYARVAFASAALLEAGGNAGDLSMRSPFSVERYESFRKLVNWDWSQFETPSGRSPEINWDQDAQGEELVSMPSNLTAQELAREAEAVAPETPAIEVIQHLAVEHKRKGDRASQQLLEF
jgi:hypothetical protein